MTERGPFPEREGRDHARTIVNAAVASVPWIGGAGVELLSSYLPASVERRRDRWLDLLDERLAGVEDRVLGNEAFQTLVLEATRAALGTHLEEKLGLLAEAVRSSADVIGRGGDDFMATRFLRWVDELEPLHFEILGAIRDDEVWVEWGVVLDRVPIEDDVWYRALEDLTSRRLVGATGYNPDRPVTDYWGEVVWVTKAGAELVRFVRLMVDDA